MDIKNITKSDLAALDKLSGSLSEIYSGVPDTKGCMENINAEGGCGAWCCEQQSPQVLYVEFLNAWHYISLNWSRPKITELVGRALRNYLSTDMNKGCIFWDKSTKLCTQHESRPLACRTYGVMPEEEWKPRYERLKVLNPGLREQCNLVSTVDDKPVTKEQTDHWFQNIKDIEHSLGIAFDKMDDKPGGTYRTFHDHIVLSLYGRVVLAELTKMKLHGSAVSKEKLVETVLSMLEKQA